MEVRGNNMVGRNAKRGSFITAMLRIVGLGIVLICPVLISQKSVAQDVNESIRIEVRKATDAMDRNLPESAIASWDKAIALAPNHIPFQYEKAVCMVMASRYLDALDVMRKIYTDTSLYDRGYQLLGNIHDFLQDTTSSRSIYRKGLEACPKSGRLHFEMGQQYYVSFDRANARRWWLAGTRVEPEYAKNYYWLSKAYADGKDKLWAIMYGEAFLNLDRNSSLTRDMSELLFVLWNSCISLADTVDPINFCSDELLEQPSSRGAAQMSFPVAFEFTVAQAAQAFVTKTSAPSKLTISQIVDLRYRFTRAWSQAGYDVTYPNNLLSYNVRLQKEGRLKEYLWWLYAYGDVKEMNKYFRANEHRYDTFLTWFSDNSMDFSRPLCLGLDCP